MVSGTNLVVGLTSAARSKRIRAFGHGCGSFFFHGAQMCVCVWVVLFELVLVGLGSLKGNQKEPSCQMDGLATTAQG